MWVGGFQNGEKYTYVIKVWPLGLIASGSKPLGWGPLNWGLHSGHNKGWTAPLWLCALQL